MLNFTLLNIFFKKVGPPVKYGFNVHFTSVAAFQTRHCKLIAVQKTRRPETQGLCRPLYQTVWFSCQTAQTEKHIERDQGAYETYAYGMKKKKK